MKVGEPQPEMSFGIGAGEADGTLVGEACLKKMPEIIFCGAVRIGVTEIIDGWGAIEPGSPAIIRSGQRCLGTGGFYARHSLSVLILVVPFIDHGIERKVIIYLYANTVGAGAGPGGDEDGAIASPIAVER